MIEPTEEQIKEVSKVMHAMIWGYNEEIPTDAELKRFRGDARAALVAAAAVPVEPVRIPDRLEVDEAKLVEVVVEAEQRFVGVDASDLTLSHAIARAIAEYLRGSAR